MVTFHIWFDSSSPLSFIISNNKSNDDSYHYLCHHDYDEDDAVKIIITPSIPSQLNCNQLQVKCWIHSLTKNKRGSMGYMVTTYCYDD